MQARQAQSVPLAGVDFFCWDGQHLRCVPSHSRFGQAGVSHSGLTSQASPGQAGVA